MSLVEYLVQFKIADKWETSSKHSFRMRAFKKCFNKAVSKKTANSWRVLSRWRDPYRIDSLDPSNIILEINKKKKGAFK